jgi:hypothetical protein
MPTRGMKVRVVRAYSCDNTVLQLHGDWTSIKPLSSVLCVFTHLSAVSVLHVQTALDPSQALH